MPSQRPRCQRVYSGDIAYAADAAPAAAVAAAAAAPAEHNRQFVGLWTCGHMMSKKALDATRDSPSGDASTAASAAADSSSLAEEASKAPGAGCCPVCSVAFTSGDVVPILPSEAEREARRR